MRDSGHFPHVDKLTCSKCKNDSFRFRWTLESYSELLEKALCHDGWGLMLEDATVQCAKCGHESPYRHEDYLEIIIEEDKA